MSNINANIRGLSERIKQVVESEVLKACLDLQAKAIPRTPIDTGDLRGSSNVRITKSQGYISGRVGFNTHYALKQHETTWYNHPRGGEWGYLIKPMHENSTRYINAIINAVRRLL